MISHAISRGQLFVPSYLRKAAATNNAQKSALAPWAPHPAVGLQAARLLLELLHLRLNFIELFAFEQIHRITRQP